MGIKEDIDALLVETKAGNAYEKEPVLELFSKMADQIEALEDEAKELDKQLDSKKIPHASTRSTNNYRNVPKGVLKSPLFGKGVKKQEVLDYVRKMMGRMAELQDDIQHKENLLKNMK